MSTRKGEKMFDLEEKINDYFLYCDTINESGKEIIKPYTLSGLLCYIGISRQEFEKIASTKRYEKLICRAKAKIEAYIEEKALTGELSISAATGSLKYNFGWGEKMYKSEPTQSGEISVVLSPETENLAR